VKEFGTARGQKFKNVWIFEMNPIDELYWQGMIYRICVNPDNFQSSVLFQTNADSYAPQE
jgi:hypothetical protein